MITFFGFALPTVSVFQSIHADLNLCQTDWNENLEFPGQHLKKRKAKIETTRRENASTRMH